MPVSKNNRKNKKKTSPKKTHSNKTKIIFSDDTPTSIYDTMETGREFESLLKHKWNNIELKPEFLKGIKAIEKITNRPLIVYVADLANTIPGVNISINTTDEIPFLEMVNSVHKDCKNIDIMLVTPGGSGQQVAQFVDKLRPRFDHVRFILPDLAMSAGTIFTMSGDDIMMTNKAYFGPIDPQIPNRQGQV